MKAVYVDDFGSQSDPVEITEEELKKRNKYLEEHGLEEYGLWVELTKLQEG